MTLEECRESSRELGRMDETGLSDARLNEYIYKAIDEFSNNVGGFAMDVYPAIAATFDTETHFAIRVTITGGTNALTVEDVSITTTARDDTTGTLVASDFQATLRTAIGGGANITVTWANFAFTVDTIDGTEITFEAPTTVTYADATTLLGLSGTTTEAGADVTGDFPEDCTQRYTIPTTAIAIQRVEWEGHELARSEMDFAQSPEATGTPIWFFLRERTLQFSPTPTSQGMCEIWYKGVAATKVVFAGYQEAGLSDIFNASSTGLAAQSWKYKVALNGSTATEYTITTTSTDTYAALIVLMNAQNSGATWTLVGGDLRLTSDTITGTSLIAVTAGSSVDLLAALSITMETAVAGDTVLPSEIPENYHIAIPFLVAYYLLLLQFEDKLAVMRRANYAKSMGEFRIERHLANTEIDRNDGYNRRLGYTVSL